MKVLVDTSVWSLALRRRKKNTSVEVSLLAELIRDGRAAMLGLVRQELLSGIRHQNQFHKLRHALGAFEDFPVSKEDYELAAECCNQCLEKGISAGNTDFLLSAVAINKKLSILSTDKDFIYIANILPIKLLLPDS